MLLNAYMLVAFAAFGYTAGVTRNRFDRESFGLWLLASAVVGTLWLPILLWTVWECASSEAKKEDV